MPTSQETYSAMLKEHLSPALRDLGFQGSGGNYRLASDTAWMLLGFQKSVESDASQVHFTVNASVIPKRVWDEMRKPGWPERPNASRFYGTWATQQRVGPLRGDGQGDKWWHVRADQPTDAVVADVLADIRGYVVPWMTHQAEAQGC